MVGVAGSGGSGVAPVRILCLSPLVRKPGSGVQAGRRDGRPSLSFGQFPNGDTSLQATRALRRGSRRAGQEQGVTNMSDRDGEALSHHYRGIPAPGRCLAIAASRGGTRLSRTGHPEKGRPAEAAGYFMIQSCSSPSPHPAIQAASPHESSYRSAHLNGRQGCRPSEMSHDGGRASCPPADPGNRQLIYLIPGSLNRPYDPPHRRTEARS